MSAAIALLMASIAFAGGTKPEFEVVRERSGAIRLYGGKDCGEVRRQIRALIAWRVRVDGVAPPEPTTAFSTGRTCSLDVTGVLPDFVRWMEGRKPAADGPNCWNSTLASARILPALRYTTPEEFSYWMDSPLCRSLEEAEERLPGDIGAIRTESEGNPPRELHAFVYLTPELCFSKNGYSRKSPYGIQSLQGVIEKYSDEVADDEDVSVEYYRCISLEEFVRARPTQSRPVQENAVRCLDQIDARLSDYSLYGASVDLAPFEEALDALKREAKDQAREAAGQESDLWGAILHRIRALEQQITLARPVLQRTP